MLRENLRSCSGPTIPHRLSQRWILSLLAFGSLTFISSSRTRSAARQEAEPGEPMANTFCSSMECSSLNEEGLVCLQRAD